MLELKKINDKATVADYLAETISRTLKNGQRVLWLVAGGSAMNVAVEAAQKMTAADNLENLSISLTDERYGDVGHADSNWRQLEEKGFNLPGARMLPVLDGKDIDETASHYSNLLNSALDASDYSLALAGMGPDGHIFGIKPHSPSVDSHDDVAAYNWDDFSRLTPTLRLLKRLDEVVIYAVGKEKHPQLDMLNKDIPAQDQPAQQLKQLKKVIIFNDYKGEQNEDNS